MRCILFVIKNESSINIELSETEARSLIANDPTVFDKLKHVLSHQLNHIDYAKGHSEAINSKDEP